MSVISVIVPDFGDDDGKGAEIIEICVAPGEQVNKEDSLLVLESEKATFEMPSPEDGEILSFSVQVGDTLTQGSVIGEMLTKERAVAEDRMSDTVSQKMDNIVKEKQSSSKAQKSKAQKVQEISEQDLIVPDFGDDDDKGAEIIEVCVAPGDRVKKEDSVLVLESEKATFEMPSPVDGEIESLSAREGDRVKQGSVIGKISSFANLQIESVGESVSEEPLSQIHKEEAWGEKKQSILMQKPTRVTSPHQAEKALPKQKSIHAGPAVRRLARDLGVDLTKVTPTGPRNRIIKEDIYEFVKGALNKPSSPFLPELPDIDFSKFGDVEPVALNKLRQVSARNLGRSWLTIPHVTQFDEANITDLEELRKSLNSQYSKKGIKITIPALMVKICADLLIKYPDFNASLHSDGKTLIRKHYYHIGMAVDTPKGLLVPVIKNANEKNIGEISQELSELANKARENRLMPQEMQGGTFSITSLGGIGGTAFTPIVNWPEVAILGLSRAQYKPFYNGKEFEPGLMLPLSLSYDHRVIDGVAAAKFTTELVNMLADARDYFTE